MKVEAAKCNLRYSSCWIVDRIAKYQYFFVEFLGKVAEVNVFTDEEGETEAEAERERGGKRKENNIIMNSVRKMRVKFGESF
jgi:hypothetical protein